MQPSAQAFSVPAVNLGHYETLLAEIVAQNSISSADATWDHSNETTIAILERWFSSLGFRTEVTAVDQTLGKFNLVATLGEGDGGLVLAGHTDTVPFDAQRWSSDPFKLTLSEGKYYGLGSCDMKGFFPIIIEALRALEQAPLKQPLIILATADEESSMAGARAIAKTNNIQARAAIIGEPTSIKPVRMHKGIMMESIEIRGKSGHSSNPSLGNNALEALHSFTGDLLRYRQQLQANYTNAAFEVATPTMNLGAVHGGDSPNRICGQCAMNFDLRPLPGMSIDALYNDLQALAERTRCDHQIEISLTNLVEPVPAFETDKDSELVVISERLTRSEAHAVAFATEAPFLSAMGMETIVMGAGSIDQAHQPNEYLAIDQVKQMALVLKRLISHYCIAD